MSEYSSEDVDNELYEVSHVDEILEDIIKEQMKFKKPTVTKKSRQYVDPEELHEELIKHIFNKKINPEHIMHRKLAVLCMKITDELCEKGNFRGYFNGWKYEMKSKAYENIVKYVHQYDSTFVDQPDFFVNWIYRVHELKLQDFFNAHKLSFDDFKDTLMDVKKKFVKKSKDPDKVIKDTYKKVTAIDFFSYLDKHCDIDYDIDSYKEYIFKKYPDMESQFEAHKKRNSFNYVTQVVYRSCQHVIKHEKKNKKDDQRLDEAILYRTDDFDEEAIENDSRYMTFDDNKLDYGGFGY